MVELDLAARTEGQAAGWAGCLWPLFEAGLRLVVGAGGVFGAGCHTALWCMRPLQEDRWAEWHAVQAGRAGR